MGSLGFRPPQFSEELAWLPACLQRITDSAVQPRSPSHQQFKEFSCIQGEDSELLLSKEDIRCNSFCLILSGEDNSPISSFPSSKDVLHFHLNLSSDGDSQYYQSQLFSAACTQHGSKNVLQLPQIEIPAGEKNDPVQNEDGACGLNALPMISIPRDVENVGEKTALIQNEGSACGVNALPIISIPRDMENVAEKTALIQNEESACGVNALPITSNPRDVENVGEKIALIQTKDSSCAVNALPMISISRDVENFGAQSSNDANDGSEHSIEKVTSRNLKSTDIKDAVELSIAASEALVIHELVKSDSGAEALPTAAVLEAALQVKQARLESSEDAFDCPTETSDEMDFLSDLDDLTMADAFEDVGLSFSCFSNQHACDSDVSLVKDTPVSEDCFRSGNRTENAEHFSPQNKPSDYPTASSKNSDPILHEMVEEISYVSATAERVGFSKVDASLQSQADLHCSDLCDLKNAAGESNASPFVTDGFRSRWLGGWTGKEADPEQLKPKTKNITMCFAAETSFFSESADVAPDENSLVRKCANERSNIASDQSVHFEGLPDQVDEGIMVSQDVRSSYPSLVDPLCSVVPCSISSENAGTALGQNGNCGEDSARNCPFSSVGPQNENMHVESTFETRQDLPEFDGEYSAPKVRRQLTSLKIYSKVLHENDSILGSPRLCVNQLTYLHLRDKNSGIRFCDKKNSEMSLAQSSKPECTISRDAEENIAVNNPDGEGMNDKHYEHPKDRAQLQYQPSMGKSSLLILPQRIRQRLQAAKLLDCGSKANAEQIVAEDVSVFHNSGSNIQGMQSECNNDMKVPARKRVHFSEIEVDFQKNKELTTRQSSHKKSSASRPGKRFKPDAQIEDGKRGSTMHFRHQKGFLFQDIKFLLTGFSRAKEKEIEGLIWKYGGIVLVDVPSPSNRGKRCSRHKFQQLPIILCPKKLQTKKFMYGCAVNSLILKDKWLTDSVTAGSALSPEKYMILSNQPETRLTRIWKPVRHDNGGYIFDGVGVMLHGKPHFCTKFAKVIQHGGGRVFKTLLCLIQNLDAEKISMAVIVCEGENRASRHLRQCASERTIPMMPSGWIVRSLYSGKLLPFNEKKHTTLHAVTASDCMISDNWSQEI
ncbi:uncharacterized protein LOC108489549 isoform X1 [Gossypium arboreum]|uniref:BRCT domain-containing protein n=1 Tax=Gossypium arboreum TaxID=29729 RepID=A0ABR0NL63_GOSAR|nr:uncharacterized protein LOC108489549 isoform X1 [Gossypium arboreum]XP_052876380.1 uncharacterized protein LOC108489549 isoform X1 [Gossypium arboreum]KAK5794911.1 hypothetical protein PVK06_036164 [Gossypium arboreum]